MPGHNLLLALAALLWLIACVRYTPPQRRKPLAAGPQYFRLVNGTLVPKVNGESDDELRRRAARAYAPTLRRSWISEAARRASRCLAFTLVRCDIILALAVEFLI